MVDQREGALEGAQGDLGGVLVQGAHGHQRVYCLAQDALQLLPLLLGLGRRQGLDAVYGFVEQG